MEERNYSRPLLAWIALLPLLILVFYPAFNGPFLLDDTSAIQANSEIRHVTIENLVRLVRSHANVRAVDHHPVSALSFMLDYQWAGLDPFGYRISSLVYLWCAAGAVLLLFLTIWPIYQRQQNTTHSPIQTLSMAAAIMTLWAVHPFATMPANYITGRQETLLILFYVLSIAALLRGWLLLCYLSAIASFLCKEVAVTLPGALFLADWAASQTSILQTFRNRLRFYTILTISWLLLCAYHLGGGRRHEIFANGLPLATSTEYFQAQCAVLATYISKLLWPVKLQFYPYIRPVESWSEWVPALLAILLYIAFAIYSLRWSRWLAVTLVFPLLVLSPTSSVIPIPAEPAMEYRMFLPSIGFIALIVIAIWRFAPQLWLRAALILAILLPLATLSHLRSRDYQTALQLYERDIAIDPRNLNALEGLSGIYRELQLMDRATASAWKLVDWAMASNSQDHVGRGFNHLGLIEFDKRNYPAAKDFFERAIGINGNRLASLNLATVHVQLNELKAAEQLLNRHLVHSPDSQDALGMLYETRMSQLNYNEAEKTLDRLLALYPERKDLDNQRTRLLNLKRKAAEAAEAGPAR